MVWAGNELKCWWSLGRGCLAKIEVDRPRRFQIRFGRRNTSAFSATYYSNTYFDLFSGPTFRRSLGRSTFGSVRLDGLLRFFLSGWKLCGGTFGAGRLGFGPCGGERCSLCFWWHSSTYDSPYQSTQHHVFACPYLSSFSGAGRSLGARGGALRRAIFPWKCRGSWWVFWSFRNWCFRGLWSASLHMLALAFSRMAGFLEGRISGRPAAWLGRGISILSTFYFFFERLLWPMILIVTMMNQRLYDNWH